MMYLLCHFEVNLLAENEIAEVIGLKLFQAEGDYLVAIVALDELGFCQPNTPAW